MGGEEGAWEDKCHRNENVTMDVHCAVSLGWTRPETRRSEEARKQDAMVRTCDEKRWRVRRKEADGYRSARKPKERKTEEDVGGRCGRRSEREGAVRRGGISPSCMETGDCRPISTTHRRGIKINKKKKKKKRVRLSYSINCSPLRRNILYGCKCLYIVMEIVESLLVDKVRSYYGEHASAMSDSHAIHRNARTATLMSAHEAKLMAQ